VHRRTTAVIIILLFSSTFAFGQTDWRASWKGYIGDYFPIVDSISEPGLQHFWYLELRPSSHWESVDTTGSLAHWFPIDAIQDSIGGSCPLEYIRFADDSLSFQTMDCHGLAFRFEGRFTMAPQLFVRCPNQSVLVGVLSYIRRGIVVLSGRVSFEFEDSAD